MACLLYFEIDSFSKLSLLAPPNEAKATLPSRRTITTFSGMVGSADCSQQSHKIFQFTQHFKEEPRDTLWGGSRFVHNELPSMNPGGFGISL